MHTLLFVDDETDIVDSLQRAFHKGYRLDKYQGDAIVALTTLALPS